MGAKGREERQRTPRHESTPIGTTYTKAVITGVIKPASPPGKQLGAPAPSVSLRSQAGLGGPRSTPNPAGMGAHAVQPPTPNTAAWPKSQIKRDGRDNAGTSRSWDAPFAPQLTTRRRPGAPREGAVRGGEVNLSLAERRILVSDTQLPSIRPLPTVGRTLLRQAT